MPPTSKSVALGFFLLLKLPAAQGLHTCCFLWLEISSPIIAFPLPPSNLCSNTGLCLTTLFKISKPIPPVKPSTPSALLLYSVLKPCFHLTYCILVLLYYVHGLPMWCSGKEPACQCGSARDTSSIAGSGRCPGGANGHPLQYSCLENSTDRGAWLATVHVVTKSQIWLNAYTHTHTHTHTHYVHCSFPVRKYLEQELWSGFTCCYIFSPPCA